MKSFDQSLCVSNKEHFHTKLYEEYILGVLRKDITNHLLSRKNNENDYFVLDSWAKKNFNSNCRKLVSLIVNNIIPELEALGWNCALSYGKTALFIYSTESPPENCYPDTL